MESAPLALDELGALADAVASGAVAVVPAVPDGATACRPAGFAEWIVWLWLPCTFKAPGLFAVMLAMSPGCAK